MGIQLYFLFYLLFQRRFHCDVTIQRWYCLGVIENLGNKSNELFSNVCRSVAANALRSLKYAIHWTYPKQTPTQHELSFAAGNG